jgi:hypothetical protein
MSYSSFAPLLAMNTEAFCEGYGCEWLSNALMEAKEGLVEWSKLRMLLEFGSI